MAFPGPDLILFQMEGNGNRILSRQRLFRKRKGVSLFTQRVYMGLKRSPSDYLAVSCHSHTALEGICIDKQILIDYLYLGPSNFCRDILVIKLHFLHLRGSLSVPVYDSIRTEIIIRGALSEISAVCLKFPAVAVFLTDGLVNIIPDKPALVQRFRVCQIRIFMHGAAGIPHGMGILAADKRLASVICQKFPDSFYGSIHLALHIAGIVITAVMVYPFIMNQTVRIQPAEKL